MSNSVVITNSSIVDFQSNITAVFELLNKWFNLNLLSLNFDKTNFIHLKRKNARRNMRIDILCKFSRHDLDNTLYWKTHIDELLPKLSSALSKFFFANVKISSACYTISVFKQIMPQETSSNGRLCVFSLHYELWYYF